jgi:alpha-pyrone synthase
MRSSSEVTPAVCIRRIATATPPYDIHTAFLDSASEMLHDPRVRSVLAHMAKRSQIEHRYSYVRGGNERMPGLPDADVVFRPGCFPATRKRMELFELFAPHLMRCALDRLALDTEERSRIRHVIITCCTGLFAPGLDFDAVDHLHLDSNTERTVIGFMGCYAAINGLKLARHIVRSEPDASVLMVNLELCSLHFQETQDIEKILSFLLFGDGCAASLIRMDDHGIALGEFRAIAVPETRDLIRWSISDSGFDMELSGEVPGELRKTLQARAKELDPHSDIDLWAVHPGGRSILDAVQAGLELAANKLAVSRSILRRFGNMSSATVMFVLQELMRTAQTGQRGCAMSFGPGLTAETMSFHVL